MTPPDSRYLHLGLELLRSTGGTTKAVSDFARALPGSVVAALCAPEKLQAEGPFAPEWNYLPIARSVRGKYYSVPEHAAEQRLREQASEFRGFFCHMLYRYNTNLTAQMAAASGRPYYVVPHGSLDPWVFTYRGWQKHLWLRAFGRRFLQGARAVIFATEGERRKALREVSLTNTVVLNWPVDAKPHSSVQRETIRRQFNLPVQKRLLLSFGRLHSMKRPLELIALFRRTNCPNTALVMVGPNDDVSLAECLAAAAGDERIHCLGPIYGQSLTDLVGACDAYVSWSQRENFNYCLAESMAAGLPVLAGPGNDLAVDLRAHDCGWFPGTDAPGDFAAALQAFAATSPEDLLNKGRLARAFAEEKFSPAGFSHSLQTLLET